MGFIPSGGSSLQVQSFPISSSQILNGFTTPVTLLPSLGSGLGYVPISVTWNYRFGGTPYTIGTAGNLTFGSNLGVFQVSPTGLIDQAASGFAYTYNTFTPATGIAGNWSPASWKFSIQTANPTVGNGTLLITVAYWIQSVT